MENLTASASDLGRGIGAGDIDPVALTEAYLAAIAAHSERHRIYTVVTEARARAEARAARGRQKGNTRQGLLDGVPISWKDLFDSAGTATEAGSKLLKGRVPVADAAVLAHATRAGLVCLGKTHMTELAFSGVGLNPSAETPPNALDAKLAPGGSSSGAAVSTGLGLAAAGIGSDTGGSVRVPAGWNGLVGLKTTISLLSAEGIVPLAHGFDTTGPLCRSVEDAGHLLAAMGGPKAPDLSGASVRGMRFLSLDNPALAPIDDAPQAAFEAGLAKLSAAGAVIETARVEAVEEVMVLGASLFAPEAYTNWKDVIEANPDVMFPPTLERFRGGGKVSVVEYIAAWQRMKALRRVWRDRVAGYDAVLIPNCASLPPTIASVTDNHARFNDENMKALRNTRLANLMGLCALALPLGPPHCAIMAMGAARGEAALCRVGAAIERALG